MRSKKTKFRVCAFLLTIISSSILFTSIALASGRSLIATCVEQAKSEWCWAAVAENAIRWEMTPDRDQWDAVKYIKGTIFTPYPNEPGSLEDTRDAAEYISEDTESFVPSYSTYSFGFLSREIDYSNYVMIAGGYYNNDHEREGGHIVAMYGYNDEANDADDEIRYYDSGDGERHTCTYDAFCDGSYNGREYDQTVYNTETD